MVLPFFAPTTYWGVPVWAKTFDFCYIVIIRLPQEILQICFLSPNLTSHPKAGVMSPGFLAAGSSIVAFGGRVYFLCLVIQNLFSLPPSAYSFVLRLGNLNSENSICNHSFHSAPSCKALWYSFQSDSFLIPWSMKSHGRSSSKARGRYT